jgi:hypothetical protein
MKPKGEASCLILQVHPHSLMFFVDDTGHERRCCETKAAWVRPRLHQTNLGVRSSNLFGRASKIRVFLALACLLEMRQETAKRHLAERARSGIQFCNRNDAHRADA